MRAGAVVFVIVSIASDVDVGIVVTFLLIFIFSDFF